MIKLLAFKMQKLAKIMISPVLNDVRTWQWESRMKCIQGIVVSCKSHSSGILCALSSGKHHSSAGLFLVVGTLRI